MSRRMETKSDASVRWGRRRLKMRCLFVLVLAVVWTLPAQEVTFQNVRMMVPEGKKGRLVERQVDLVFTESGGAGPTEDRGAQERPGRQYRQRLVMTLLSAIGWRRGG